MKLKKTIKENIKLLEESLQSGSDIKFREFTAGNKNACAVFLDGMVNMEQIAELIIKPMAKSSAKESESLDNISNLIRCAECIICESNLETCITTILNGKAAIFIDGDSRYIEAGVTSINMRAVAEPPTAQVVKGPREGFIENIKANLSLIRKRLKTKDLTVDYLTCGRYTKTAVAVLYINTIADKKIYESVKKRIEEIDIDAILDSSYIAKFLEQHPYSIFKQIGTSEKPDVVTAKLLEGRVAVIVDGSPIVLTLPYLLMEDFQNPEDYYERKYKVSFTRLVRIFAIIIAVILPAAYVAAQVFNLSIIPLRFSLTILNSVKSIPLSPAIEMLVVVLIFEILTEASIRMPKYVSMSLSVVGSLVLGQTAVSAGIISTPTLLIMAISALSVFCVPELLGPLSIIRILFVFLAGSLGIFGIMLGAIFLGSYIVSLESYGAPLFAPYAPIVVQDLKDGIVKKELMDQTERPRSFSQINSKRIKVKTEKNKN